MALRGEADFHALAASGVTIYGWDATDGVVMRSDDGGQRWQVGAALAAVDLDVDPTDPVRVLAATEQGLQESLDGGVSFTPVAGQPPRPVLLLDHVLASGPDGIPSVIGMDASGGAWALSGEVWTQLGSLPGPPQAFTIAGVERYLAATAEGVLSSEDAGRTWSMLAPAGDLR